MPLTQFVFPRYKLTAIAASDLEMAIIDTLPAVNVSVRLRTSFRDALEYPDPYAYQRRERYLDDFERCSRNYIESQNGVEFAIHIDVVDHPSLDPWVYGDFGLVFFLLIDGQFMGKRFCHSDDFFQRHWHFAFKGKRHPNDARSAMVQRDFSFASITTLEEDASNQEIRRARDLGTIEEPRYDTFEIPEEALKGRPISHGTSQVLLKVVVRCYLLTVALVSLARAYEAPLRPPRRDQRAAFEKVHTGPLLATYTFKYRSSEALRIEEIVPRTPSPEPMGVDTEEPAFPGFEELQDEQIERLARERLRQLKDEALQAQVSSKKRSYDDFCDLTQDDDDLPARPYKVVKLRTGHEVIDLTGDD
ncbi:hypothetical protein CkaCkLH20_04956 [Colletotrichum karsti]|uniref:DUF7918 domain-containing protein n=1 Tax=Colletotrichum karsti TaxID=1095194 RepID=A0A9P6IC56_9PEZI|nr:uncharacterized protein CkaCkLH20_04956 [Colletotrichum karsti]KAF9877821.1 hypothetical protein CkaCkLH20_04956 [Colletotrichum karsti]